jgi:hypothetical protein
MPLAVWADWAGYCEAPLIATFLGSFSKTGRSNEVGGSCGRKSFQMQIRCEPDCLIRDDDGRTPAPGQHGGVDIYVTPLETGPFSFAVELREMETGERYVYESPAMTVREPDAVGLLCLPANGKLKGAFAPCDDRPIASDRPYFIVVGEIAGRVYALPGALINGRGDVPRHEVQALLNTRDARSLRDLFPEAAIGSGVRTGTYTVRVTHGSLSSTRTLTVE